MTSITEGLLGQLQGNPISQIGQRLGISPGMAATAVSAALPLIIGALGRNSRQPQGAQSLFNALQRDHANQDVNSALGSSLSGTGQGGEILGHIFGPRAPQVLPQHPRQRNRRRKYSARCSAMRNNRSAAKAA